jgi:hypothetical protein
MGPTGTAVNCACRAGAAAHARLGLVPPAGWAPQGSPGRACRLERAAPNGK